MEQFIGNQDPLTIKELYINEKPLSTIPEDIGKLINLKSLSLYENNLRGIPESIGNLTKLESLSIHRNNITNLPMSIKNLTNLKELILNSNFLEIIPSPIFSLIKLEELNLGINSISLVPDEIGNLINLKSLSLYSNQLNDIPTGIGNLTNLQYLNLYGNELTYDLPSTLGNLINLKSLNLRENFLSFIPDEIGNLTNLQELNLSNNRLMTLPYEIGNLTNLQELNLSNNRLIALPEDIRNLLNLKKLNVTKNIFPDIKTFMKFILPFYNGVNPNIEVSSLDPNFYRDSGLQEKTIIYVSSSDDVKKYIIDMIEVEVNTSNRGRLFMKFRSDERVSVITGFFIISISNRIGELIHLTTLDLGFNMLSIFPEGIAKLVNLGNLHLNNNLLETLPDSIENLINLKNLYLGSNKISIFPNSITRLIGLESLWLNKNLLETLPNNIGNLTNLRFLNLNENKINSLPNGIGNLTNLMNLGLKYNKLINLKQLLKTIEPIFIHSRSPEIDLSDNPMELYTGTDLRISNAIITINNIYTYMYMKNVSKRFKELSRKAFPEKFEGGPPIFIWQNLCKKPGLPVKELYNYLINETLQTFYVKGKNMTKENIDKFYLSKYANSLRKNYTEKTLKRYICMDLVNIYNDYLSYVSSDTFKGKCGDSTLLGDEWNEVPFGEIILFKEDPDSDIFFCLTVDVILLGNGKNPFTNKKLSEDVLELAKTRKELYSDWVVKGARWGEDDNNREIDPNELYTALWNKLSHRGYPIDIETFKGIAPNQVRDMYSLIRNTSPMGRVMKPSLNEGDIYLDFVGQMLVLLSDRSSEDSSGDILLINEVMGEITARNNELYTSLWNKLELFGRPIDMATFNGASSSQIGVIYFLIKNASPLGGIIKPSLNEEGIHLDFVNQMLVLLSNRTPEESSRDILSINEKMREIIRRRT